MSTAIKSVPAATGLSEDKPLPNSRRIYIEGQQTGVRVAFLEIYQKTTRHFRDELEENPPVRVYETSGPYGDPSIRTDVREGLKPVRLDWIRSEEHTSELQSRFGTSYA